MLRVRGPYNNFDPWKPQTFPIRFSLPPLDNLGDSMVKTRNCHRGRFMGENASEKGDKELKLIRSFTVRLILVFVNERHSRHKSVGTL